MKPKTIRVWVARDKGDLKRTWIFSREPINSGAIFVNRCGGWMGVDFSGLKPGEIRRARLIIEPRGRK